MKKWEIFCLVVVMLILSSASIVLGQSRASSEWRYSLSDSEKIKSLGKEIENLLTAVRDMRQIVSGLHDKIELERKLKNYDDVLLNVASMNRALAIGQLVPPNEAYLQEALLGISLYGMITEPALKKTAWEDGITIAFKHSADGIGESIEILNGMLSTEQNVAVVAQGMRIRDELYKAQEFLRSMVTK